MGVYLFAMFRLGPRVSRINKEVYNAEGQLPHLIRTQEFVADLESNREKDNSEYHVPNQIDSVSFENVCFSYSEGTEQITDISFNAQRGEFIAFVGPSGAGKSTILSLLASMYEPDSGRITANGRKIQSFDLEQWRSSISVVRQNPYIFNKTLQENITIGRRDATKEEIDRVCEIAQVTEFLEDLPEGYGTHLGDDGVKLSGGQRQRVALARALLKEADLIILDEATSDLDTNIEDQVHSAIESMERDVILIVVAHRLSTVRNADVIYALEDGQISERGSHSELLNQDGMYAELYSAEPG